MKKLLSDFKEFALKGNVLDMAVGVVIGGAFKAIVDALVNNIIMPLIGALCKTTSISELSFMIGEAKVEYGLFIDAIINFIIIAFTIFVVVKTFEKAKKSAPWHKEEEKAEEPDPEPEPSAEEKLLTEIRDLLAEKK